MAYGYGKGLEQMVEMANEAYKRRGLALIEKQEVPMVIQRSGKSFPKEKSIVDYVGFKVFEFDDDIKHIPVAFDVKETRDDNKFSLSYIKPHQYKYLKMRAENFPGTMNFIVVNCLKLHKCYRINFPELKRRWEGWQSGKGVPDDNKNGSYASISFEWLQENMEPIKSKNGIILDYLNIA